MKFTLPYISEDTDRHGNVRLYYRRDGRKVRLPGPVGSPEFLAAYKAAQTAPPPKADPMAKGTLRWLCAEYYRSAGFKALDARTRKVRARILDKLCLRHGHKVAAEMEAKNVRLRRDEMADRPEAANEMLKALRQLFRFGVTYDHLTRNVARDVEYLSSGSQGYHSWTLDEIAQYEAAHPVGTKARLALALLLYTMQRRSDVILLGRQHVQAEHLVFTQFKGRNRGPVRLSLPIIPELRRIIDASPCGDMAFLVTEWGRPFSAQGFSNRFKKWCLDAGLPHCTPHGLRKAGLSRLAELGCSEMEIMAVSGHRTSKEVTRYTKAASQRIRAVSAMDRLANESVPLSEAMTPGGTISAHKSLKTKGGKNG